MMLAGGRTRVGVASEPRFHVAASDTPSSLPSGAVTTAMDSPRLRSRSANSAGGRSARTVDGPASITSSARAAGSPASACLRSRLSSVVFSATTSANPYGERATHAATWPIGSSGRAVTASRRSTSLARWTCAYSPRSAAHGRASRPCRPRSRTPERSRAARAGTRHAGSCLTGRPSSRQPPAASGPTAPRRRDPTASAAAPG
jgi:hypothetical protein